MVVSPWLFWALVVALVLSVVGWLIERVGRVYWRDSSATWREYSRTDLATVRVQLDELGRVCRGIRDDMLEEVKQARLERDVVRLHEKELADLRAWRAKVESVVSPAEEA